MDFVNVYRKDSLNDLMRVSKEHYELYKDRFVLQEHDEELQKEKKEEEKVVQKRKPKV